MIGKWGFVKYICLGILSGVFSFLFINLLTRVVGAIIAGSFNTISQEYIVLFALVILFFIWIRKMLSLSIIDLSQRLLWNLRTQVLSLVLNANYQQLYSRKTKVHNAMFNDVYVIIDASMNVIGFCTNLILSIACLIYLLSISPLLFSITLVIAIMGTSVYHFSTKRTASGFEAYRKLENRFFDSFNDILEGFKEIYMEPKIGRNIFQNKITFIARDSFKNNIKAFTGFVSNQVIGQILSYILISSVLLYFSVVLKIKATDIISFVFTLLYLLGAVEAVMLILPGLIRAKIAAANLMDLKKELEEARFDNPLPEKYLSRDDFSEIAVRGLKYQYSEGDNPFAIGPINFDVKKGDIVFIYGGNGSGKTTFMQSILGVYIPTEGEITLNKTPVTHENYANYRTLFSVVFSNFYL